MGDLCLCSVTKSCPALWGPTDCSPPGFSVHEISLSRIPEWVAISFSRRSSWAKDQTHVPCISRQIFTTEPMGTLKNTDMRRDYGLYETKMFLTRKPTGLEADLLSLLTWVYSFNLNSIPSALFLRGCEGFSFKYLGGGKETNKTSYPEVIFQF